MFKKVFAVVFVGLLGLVGVCSNSYAEIYSSISGRVVDADTGEGIGNISVVLMRSRRQMKTDHDGSFHFNKLKPGIYDLYLNEIQYRAGGYLANNDPYVVKVKKGKNITNIQLKTRKGVAVKGFILESGKPVSNALVEVNPYESDFNGLSGIMKTSSNLEGFYELLVVPPTKNIVIDIKCDGRKAVRKTFSTEDQRVVELDFDVSIEGANVITGYLQRKYSDDVLSDWVIEFYKIFRKENTDYVEPTAIAQTKTNQNGEYSIVNLPVGSYDIKAYPSTKDDIGFSKESFNVDGNEDTNQNIYIN